MWSPWKYIRLGTFTIHIFAKPFLKSHLSFQALFFLIRDISRFKDEVLDRFEMLNQLNRFMFVLLMMNKNALVNKKKSFSPIVRFEGQSM